MNKYNPYNIVDKSWNKYLPFVKFCLMVVTNIAIPYTIYYILLTSGVNYLLANTVDYIMGILNGTIQT